MKTESNIKPAMVERYPGLVRVCFAVEEKQVKDSRSEDERTMYAYQMVEMRELPKSYDELFALLYYDRYPVAEQVHTLASGTQSDIFALDRYRRECVRTAKALLNIPYTLDERKEDKIAEITAYDASEAVNSFTYKGVSMWLDKETRTGLYLRFLSEKAAGNTQTTLWSGTRSFTLNIEDGLKLLAAVEVYASAAYDVTAKHKANVLAMTSMDAVDGYDYKTGYPQKLSI